MSLSELKAFKPKKDFFVGIDSDGCAFDTMELKHKECFCPAFINIFELQAVSKYAREAWDFCNLYSHWRGANRFPEVVRALDLLRNRPEVIRRNATIPSLPKLEAWIKQESKLGNPALIKTVEETNDPELKHVLKWSLAVNQAVDQIVRGCAPFPGVRDALSQLQDDADCMVVSATPEPALNKEWTEHDIAKFVTLIAGQESGNKKEHLAIATKDRYAKNHVLMIGDALGDYNAALANNALFFPICPGQEEQSWQLFLNEAMDKFLNEELAGAYQQKLIDQFKSFLPDLPPWLS